MGWMEHSKRIDEEPESLQFGQTVTIIYGECVDVVQHMKGIDRQTRQPYEYDRPGVKLKVNLGNGGFGFIVVRKKEFSAIAKRFMDAGFPKELTYTSPEPERRRRY